MHKVSPDSHNLWTAYFCHFIWNGLYPTCCPKLIDSLNRKDLHRAFKIANIFSTGENSGVFIGIYT